MGKLSNIIPVSDLRQDGKFSKSSGSMEKLRDKIASV